MASEQKSLQQIIEHRLEKLASIKEAGFAPYPYNYRKTHSIAKIKSYAEALLKSNVAIAGRIVSIRKMGKASFTHIQDETGKLQIYIRRDDIGADVYNKMFKKLDLGDFIGIKGYVFYTQTDELSVHAEQLELLAKSIHPLPNLKEKDGQAFNEFDDKELRYRHRYLDFIANPDNKITFKNRAKIISAIRKYFDERDYIEVETPVLQPIYGGASARPFTTFHNTLDQKLYLRIAVELYLKQLVIGGFEKVYEIARTFRNEGMDRNHNPEFTLLEWYQAYSDVYEMMEFTENLIKFVCASIGKTKVNFSGVEIDLNLPFAQKSMFTLLNEKTGTDVQSLDETGLFKLAKQHELDVSDKMNYGQLLDKLFSELIEPDLMQPTFVLDHPKAISPLAKEKRDGNPEIVERFELFIGGTEFANAFSELNDPIEQRRRLEAQAQLRELGDDEAQVVDENFLKAMEVGMPPTGGVGIGVDRLIMLLTEQNSIKDVILFPAMRPEGQ